MPEWCCQVLDGRSSRGDATICDRRPHPSGGLGERSSRGDATISAKVLRCVGRYPARRCRRIFSHPHMPPIYPRSRRSEVTTQRCVCAPRAHGGNNAPQQRCVASALRRSPPQKRTTRPGHGPAARRRGASFLAAWSLRCGVFLAHAIALLLSPRAGERAGARPATACRIAPRLGARFFESSARAKAATRRHNRRVQND